VNDVYSPSIHEVLWGLVLLVVTMFFHAQTTLIASTVYRRELGEISAHPSRQLALFGLLSFGCMPGVVHLIDVLIWASFFSLCGCFKAFGTSFYVALANYTTVGSNINLPQRWQLLGPMSAATGLLMFGWSAAILVMVTQRFREAGRPLL
jgi:hypothetical protein